MFKAMIAVLMALVVSVFPDRAYALSFAHLSDNSAVTLLGAVVLAVVTGLAGGQVGLLGAVVVLGATLLVVALYSGLGAILFQILCWLALILLLCGIAVLVLKTLAVRWRHGINFRMPHFNVRQDRFPEGDKPRSRPIPPNF